MANSENPPNKSFYQAPKMFMGIFYAILLAWTFISILVLWSMSTNTKWPLAMMLMVVFIVVYAWYFALGISYKIGIGRDGEIEFISFRKVISINPEEISLIEGPRLIFLPYGFVRFRLAREKAYMFSRVTDEDLQGILNDMKKAHRHIRFKGL